MGLLDDYDRLLGGRPKTMPAQGMPDPTASIAMTAGDDLDPFMSGRRAEALEVRGAPPPNIPGGMLAGPNQQRAFAAGDRPYGPQTRNLGIAQADAAPPKINLAEMNYGLGDNFPGVKNQTRLAEGLPMTAPEPEAAPPPKPLPPPATVAENRPSSSTAAPAFPPPRPSGLLSPKAPPPTQFAETAPLPPPRGMLAGPPPNARAELPPRPAPAMPVPRPPVIAGGGLPQSAPMPPVRPPELGGIETAALTPPAPIADNPIIGMGGDTAVGAAGAADAGSAIGGAAAGGIGAMGGILDGIGGLVKAFGGGGSAPPPAKPPQLSPSNAGPTVDAEIAQDRQMAPQILAGILANNPKSLLDPRRQRQA